MWIRRSPVRASRLGPGEVIVMLGGSGEGVERARDLLDCFAKTSFHLGPWGAGAQMKLISNLVLGLNRAALAEGLSLARNVGLDLQQTLEVLKAGMSYSRIMETKGEKMRLRDYTPQAKLAQHLKDVELIRAEGTRLGMPLPFSGLHAEILSSLVAQGLGDLDNSAIQEFFHPEDSREQKSLEEKPE
ncbi:MAG: NAD-binding protein [Planctomycetales bacterium]